MNWATAFPTVRLFHVATSVSDHSILVLKESCSTRKKRKRSKVWHFESMWLEDKRCNEGSTRHGKEAEAGTPSGLWKFALRSARLH